MIIRNDIVWDTGAIHPHICHEYHSIKEGHCYLAPSPLLLLFIVVCVAMMGCKSDKVNGTRSPIVPLLDTIVHVEKQKTIRAIDHDTMQWQEITEESGIYLDIRYATENNFTKKQIYSCGRCFLRPTMAKKVLTLQRNIHDRYRLDLKLYDCYRPRPAQQKLWDIVPDARYVTPPHRGSMHNRGLAIDVTLVSEDGEELDMGTPYDYFGPEAYTTNTTLPKEVLKNREILTKMMEIHGIKGIRTEWWHYSLKSEKAELAEWEWECN